MNRYVVVALLLSALGNSVQATTAKDIVGVWAQTGDACEGDNGITYRRDGTWDVYSESGRWVLSGNELITTTTYRGEADEHLARLKHPRREVTTVLSVSRQSLIERWSDGSVHRFHRCR